MLVHHGIFWTGAPLALTPAAKRRLQLLFEHDMALAAYHLPLDGHPEVGNNALIAAGLGCAAHEPFALHKGMPIGVAGRFAGDGIAPDELVARVRELTGREPLAFLSGPERVRTIGIVSGARLGLPRRGDRRRPRRLPDGRADRARHEAGRTRTRSTSSPPATTRPRRSASAASATCSPSASGSATSSSTSPTRSETMQRLSPSTRGWYKTWVL